MRILCLIDCRDHGTSTNRHICCLFLLDRLFKLSIYRYKVKESPRIIQCLPRILCLVITHLLLLPCYLFLKSRCFTQQFMQPLVQIRVQLVGLGQLQEMSINTHAGRDG